jgi:Homeodomain-like domain-containing protein
MPRPVSSIDLTAEEKAVLQRRVRSGTTSQREHLRARIISLRSQGHKEQAVANNWGVSLPCISKWSHRFELQGLAGLNDKLVERFFAELTEDAIRAGSLGSVGELIRAIEQYLTYWRENPKRYTWHAKGEDILAKIQRAREALGHIK